MSIKVLFCAGEASGDEHLSCLLEQFRILHPDSEFRGMAGSKTRKLGIQTELELEKYASVMGFFDVLSKTKTIYSALSWFKNTILEWKPDILIIVDYPDFNLKLAKIAKENTVKTFYFIAPKLWAWRESRINKIKKFVDCLGLIFPFEKSFYNKLGYRNCYYVGHPFTDSLTKEETAQSELVSKHKFLKEHGLQPEIPTLAVFPGSRTSEINKNMPLVMEVIKSLCSRVNNLQVLLSGAETVKELLNTYTNSLKDLNVKILEGKNLEILRYSDFGLIKSGTSNLQAAFYLLPFVMIYKTNAITLFIVNTFVKIKQYSLVNIIKKSSIEEFVGNNISPEQVADKLELLLEDKAVRQQTISKLEFVRDQLKGHQQLNIFAGSTGSYQRAAILASTLAQNRSID